MLESWAEKYLDSKSDRCWFCNKGDCDEFDVEFDTFVHLDCVENEILHFVADNTYQTEAIFMDYLLIRNEVNLPKEFKVMKESHFKEEW